MTLEGIFAWRWTLRHRSSSVHDLRRVSAVLRRRQFFIDFSFSAMGGKSTSAGRTVVLASFLLGGPFGKRRCDDGDARFRRLPMLVKPAMARTRGRAPRGGGLGAIISPPVLGAAAFLIGSSLRSRTSTCC